ncbi:MAG: CoA transferase [Chloroflexi bacterium]|nr:CoA transferase [Chloroflexota bacterium]
METKEALSDLKVLEFGTMVTIPMVGKILADHGAKLVKIESMARVDVSRAYIPMAGGIRGINRCLAFAAWGTNKYSMALNMNRPKARDVAKKLIAWADIVIENFMPGTLEKWGLGYDSLRAIKPDIIMLRTSMQGLTGPHALQPSTGYESQARAGFIQLVGWPDRPPVGSSRPWTDHISPWYIITALMGALDYRKRTGKGQLLDVSQFEVGETFIAAAFLDYVANGREPRPVGNTSTYAAPHAAYRCLGDDRWCAIAVFTQQEWAAFCEVIGRLELANDPRFATLTDRKKNEAELDIIVEDWTKDYPPEEVMRRMQEAGVASGVVENNKDLHEDPQLEHRRHFWELDHVEMGKVRYDASSFRLSKTPLNMKTPPPLLGEHTEMVCREILGMPDEEFVELMSQGVFE